MLKEVPHIHPHLAHQAARSTPGAKVLAEGIADGLTHVLMEFRNEFVEARFHGEYRRLLYNSAHARSSHEITTSEQNSQSEIRSAQGQIA